MKFSDNDTVYLLIDAEEYGLQKGDMGVVIDTFTHPREAYEVEFLDGEGRQKAQLTLEPDEIEKW